jgi:hypothetical protein
MKTPTTPIQNRLEKTDNHTVPLPGCVDKVVGFSIKVVRLPGAEAVVTVRLYFSWIVAFRRLSKTFGGTILRVAVVGEVNE